MIFKQDWIIRLCNNYPLHVEEYVLKSTLFEIPFARYIDSPTIRLAYGEYIRR
jgi:hypothetical protein